MDGDGTVPPFSQRVAPEQRSTVSAVLPGSPGPLGRLRLGPTGGPPMAPALSRTRVPGITLYPRGRVPGVFFLPRGWLFCTPRSVAETGRLAAEGGFQLCKGRYPEPNSLKISLSFPSFRSSFGAERGADAEPGFNTSAVNSVTSLKMSQGIQRQWPGESRTLKQERMEQLSLGRGHRRPPRSRCGCPGCEERGIPTLTQPGVPAPTPSLVRRLSQAAAVATLR